MKPPRRRVDGNQAAIVAALRKHGASVEVLSSLGRGTPDLLVGVGGRSNVLMEVKDPVGLDGHKKILTDDEAVWHARWRGLPVVVVRSPDEATAYLSELLRERES